MAPVDVLVAADDDEVVVGGAESVAAAGVLTRAGLRDLTGVPRTRASRSCEPLRCSLVVADFGRMRACNAAGSCFVGDALAAALGPLSLLLGWPRMLSTARRERVGGGSVVAVSLQVSISSTFFSNAESPLVVGGVSCLAPTAEELAHSVVVAREAM